jgi:hypothetical protein
MSVETHSFLPDDQRDRCNLPRQGQTCHGRPPSLDEQTLIKIAEWPCGDAGHCCRPLENTLKIVVVILIETAQLLRFLGTLQLPLDITVLRTVTRLQAKAAVSPELALGAKTVGRLHQRDQLSRANWADARNLAQQFRRTMFSALGQQVSPRFLPQSLQRV